MAKLTALAVGGLVVLSACSSTTAGSPSSSGSTPLFDGDLTVSERWRACGVITDSGTADFRDALIEQGHQREEAETLTESSVERCRDIYRSSDAAAVLDSLERAELDEVCEQIEVGGFADFSLTCLTATFQEDVADELRDLLLSECRSEDRSSSVPADASTTVHGEADGDDAPSAPNSSPVQPAQTAPVVENDEAVLDEVGDALHVRASRGEIMDGVFVLAALEHICSGVDDFVPGGTQHNVTCSPLIDGRLRRQLCPAVSEFGRVRRESRARSEIAVAAEEMASTLDGTSQDGVTSVWRSQPPRQDLELRRTRAFTEPPLREAAVNIADFWNLTDELDNPGAGFIDARHQLLALTCGVDLTYDLAIVQDPVRAARPIGRGDEGRAVEEIQLLLIVAGESLYPDGADGRFGADTESVVRGFQARSGLPVTGAVDLDTFEELRSVETRSGAAERTENDPRCPTPDDVERAVAAAGEIGDFDVVNPSCSGRWAKAVVVYPDFADGETVLLEYRGFVWELSGSAYGDPAALCEEFDVPGRHRPRLSC